MARVLDACAISGDSKSDLFGDRQGSATKLRSNINFRNIVLKFAAPHKGRISPSIDPCRPTPIRGLIFPSTTYEVLECGVGDYFAMG